MYRDPSEFRERFKAYKDGKSVREIYGLPGYAGGSLPIDEMMPYILAVENPTKQGLVNGVWRPPTDSTKWDTHAIGGGLDIREEHNPIVYNYLKSHGRLNNPYLTEKEEANLRLTVFTKTMLPALQKMYNKYGGKISAKGYARLAGMKWLGHPFLMAISPDSITGKAFLKAIESGDKDLDSVFDAYYRYPANAKRYSARILADTDYWKSHTPSDSLQELIINVGKTQPERIIAMPDATRVATIPTVKQLTVPSTWMQQATELPNYTLELNFELNKPLNILRLVDVIDAYTPTWEGLKQSYSNGKLPGYLGGKEATIQQGRKQLPIDKAEAATEPDYNEGWLLTTLKRGANNFIKTVKDQVRSARNIVNGRGDWFDWLNVGTDVVLGAGGKAVKGAAREAKAAVKAIKPKKSSVKFNTKDPNKVGAYYTAHPEEVTPITNSEELNDVVNFINTHIAPKYARQNKVHIGIDPADIKLGFADLSGTNLGGYVGPSGEVVINQDILNNSDMLRRVLGHEVVGHWLDLHYPLTPAQASIVLNGVRFNADFLNSRPWFDLFAEGNAERRLFNYLSSRDNGNVVGSELDAIINSMPRAQAKRYADMLGYNKGIEWQWPDILPFKQAATSVPTIGIPLYAGTLIDRLYNNGKLPGYKNGKIRIKPSNRGKFNATKKRTGKTTEELTHSKNPLTRKRAIFALNARKWNHK